MVSPLDSPHVLERRLSSREPDDLRELVSRECLTPQVLTGLDSSRSYGVWWYGVKCMKLTPMGDQRRKWSKNLEYERVAVQVPDAGISHEAVDSATDALKRSYRSRKESKHLYELGGCSGACAAACLGPDIVRATGTVTISVRIAESPAKMPTPTEPLVGRTI